MLNDRKINKLERKNKGDISSNLTNGSLGKWRNFAVKFISVHDRREMKNN